MKPDISIILDMETLQITGEVILDSRLQLWLEAARRIQPRTFEIILCSGYPMGGGAAPEGFRFLVQPGTGYYGLKNAGALAAVGGVVFFGDIDCRLEPDYFVRLLAHYDSNPGLIGLGGRTYYDGSDFVTRIKTVLSWGYLHGVDRLMPGKTVVGHNISLRRAWYDFPPFGSYTERYGGDEFLSNRLRQEISWVPMAQDLKVYHESAAHSLRALLDRHLREHGRIAFHRKQGLMKPLDMLRAAWQSGRQRHREFSRERGKFVFSRVEVWAAHWIIRFYTLLDVGACAVMCVNQRLFQRWVLYQFGDKPGTPVES